MQKILLTFIFCVLLSVSAYPFGAGGSGNHNGGHGFFGNNSHDNGNHNGSDNGNHNGYDNGNGNGNNNGGGGTPEPASILLIIGGAAALGIKGLINKKK